MFIFEKNQKNLQKPVEYTLFDGTYTEKIRGSYAYFLCLVFTLGKYAYYKQILSVFSPGEYHGLPLFCP